jgi:GxxExxY protein
MNDDNLLYQAETFAIRGAVFEVWKQMGTGFLESVYQECLTREFAARSIPAVAHMELRLAYKGEPLGQTFKPDFVCYEKIIVELKHAKSLVDDHRAQVLNYLRATDMKVGLLVNFGCHPKAQIERFVL